MTVLPARSMTRVRSPIKSTDFRIAADGKNPIFLDGNGLQDAEGRIDRDDFAIAQYEVGRLGCNTGLRLQHQSKHGKNRQRPQRRNVITQQHDSGKGHDQCERDTRKEAAVAAHVHHEPASCK